MPGHDDSSGRFVAVSGAGVEADHVRAVDLLYRLSRLSDVFLV
jgi:hypothetical protein